MTFSDPWSSTETHRFHHVGFTRRIAEDPRDSVKIQRQKEK